TTPAAPPRFSTTTVLPSDSPMYKAIRRAIWSLLPPGAHGTTIRIGRSGQAPGSFAQTDCAVSPDARVQAAIAAPRNFLRARPRIVCNVILFLLYIEAKLL